MKDRFVSPDELAKYLKIARGTVYNMKAEGRIPFTKVGGRLRFDIDKIEKWLAEQSGEPRVARRIG
jgi:excisionase family DNA binding protein